ncbi:hypothetical protein I8J29_24605 [Paenibacillus sp. MWE-103]|uniref:Uncharacterized protein n=1 Tax=Paenibacillus artemisiicola TaxID=1172618 RepID=A0ABS3WGX1_9BACL|nr:hypothetical protein [Paenibacillus artemisiicola]MBO7747371.1 hypothetical protein [Paenibacillus artemisiicola]
MFEQLELFPSVTDIEVRFTKKLLESYKKMRLLVNGTENTTPKYLEASRLIGQVEQAVGLILDDEAKRIVEFRFLKGNTHKATVLFFSGMMSDSTVDRKLNKGIESVAETLKFWHE